MSPFDKEGNLKLLPQGEQVFEKIISREMLYVDKTDKVYQLANRCGTSVFLSRPRRFGKSLLCSTLEAYFEGRKELFEGLKIASLEKDWEKYPVLSFSMNWCKYPSVREVAVAIGAMLEEMESAYGIVPNEGANLGDRLVNLIRSAHERSGKGVVVIIDDYDAPYLDVLCDDAMLAEVRVLMRNFYGVLKPLDKYLRFLFMTGTTKFAQFSLFCDLNNVFDISMFSPFADICGFTQGEIDTQLRPNVQRLAEAIGKDYEGAMLDLKNHYGGYHFVWPSDGVYSPFSLMCALDRLQLESYWFEAVEHTFLIEMMHKFQSNPTKLESVKAQEVDFDRCTDTLEGVVPLMYQSGYLTLKDYEEEFDEYTLGFPNKEIREGLMDCLARRYAVLR